mgnify:CR=1 FL=1|tara:strand:- start:1142 stop:1933 length:792 start_codon:yes stop_codon:yes gene_type:complete
MIETKEKLQMLIDEKRGKIKITDPQIDQITATTVRVVRDNLKTKSNQFKFKDGKIVPPHVDYHIHYTSNLTEHYMTGIAHDKKSLVIYPIEDITDFSIYNKLNKQVPLEIKSSRPNPTEEDYLSAFMVRYFARKTNNPTSPILEISKNIFSTSPLYDYVFTKWMIRGDMEVVQKYNESRIKIASKKLPSLKKYLSPFQMYRREKDSNLKLDIMERLNLTESVNDDASSNESSTSTQTTSNQATGAGAATGPPPGVTTGGAGGY